MSELCVVTDSGADISKTEADELGVTVVPLVVNFGSETFLDKELDSETFWQKAETVHPQSSQPPVGAFAEAFAALVNEGARVLCITLTSKHSGTFNSAWAAAQSFVDKVTVFDSQAVSWGQRFQVEAAAKAARAGRTLGEVLDTLKGMQDRIHMFALVDTVEYLQRGGRVDGVISVIKHVVRVFNIKPLLELRNGEVKPLGVVNSLTRGLLRIEREVLALGPIERLGVMHIRSRDRAAKLAQELSQRVSPPLPEVPIIETGVALATHGGPGVIAAFALVQADH